MSLEYLPWQRPAEYDDRPCVRDTDTDLTYAGIAARVDAAAEQLAEHGVTPGQVVAVMLPNQVEFLVGILAAWRIGAAATPVNPALTPPEAAHQLSDSGAAVVVTDDPSRAGDTPALVVGDLRTTPEGTLPPAQTSERDLALLIYTSGSTGRPKGVMLSHGNLDAMIRSMGTALQVTADDHCLLVLPLFHANALCVSFLTPISVGAQLSVLPRFDPVEFLEAIARLRPTYFSGVPTIFTHLLSVPAEQRPDTSPVRVAICGAAPAAPELLQQVEQSFGFPVIEGYGLSEGTCASTCNPLDGVRKPGTVGPALPGQRVAVMARDGTLLPPGEPGEVVIRGDVVMQGYLNRPEATTESIGDGWLHTGDVGVLDEDGYLRIVDRIKDMILRGGENLYPQEIEDVLHGADPVMEAAVVGRPDPVYGEVPVALVTAQPGTEVDVAALIDRCRERLTRVKVPDTVHVLETLPHNAVGKIDKPTLRSRVATPDGQGA